MCVASVCSQMCCKDYQVIPEKTDEDYHAILDTSSIVDENYQAIRDTSSSIIRMPINAKPDIFPTICVKNEADFEIRINALRQSRAKTQKIWNAVILLFIATFYASLIYIAGQNQTTKWSLISVGILFGIVYVRGCVRDCTQVTKDAKEANLLKAWAQTHQRENALTWIFKESKTTNARIGSQVKEIGIV